MDPPFALNVEGKRIKQRSLAARLLLLVIVATAPALVTLIHLQRELRSERSLQARTVVLQQAEQVHASMQDAVEGARQLMLAIARMSQVQSLSPECGAALAGLQTAMPQYSFIAIADADGGLVCTSTPGMRIGQTVRSLTQLVLSQSHFMVGVYSEDAAASAPFLPVALPYTARNGVRAAVVAGFSLDWMNGMLAAVPAAKDSSIAVEDRNGVTLARVPAGLDSVCPSPGSASTAVLNASVSGTAMLPCADGVERLVGYVPATAQPKGLFVSAGFPLAAFNSSLDDLATRGYTLVAFGTVLSLLFALFIGQRVVRAPAAVLLDAARGWGRGELSSRAALPDYSASEFVQISDAFNAMAEALEAQTAELQSLTDVAEARVAERTRALLDSNNRLQVEIAEREMSEARLRQAQKLQAIGQLAGGIAHDFNNLLASILGSLELLQQRLSHEPKLLRLIDAATMAVERGSRLTSRLLAFSSKQPSLSVPVDIGAEVSGMLKLLESTLGPSIQVEARIPPDLWPALLDRGQFATAMLNLALNARDAMPRGGRLTIAASNHTIGPAKPDPDMDPGDYVRLVVADSGSGMSEDILSRAFEPFFTTRTAREGGGLGLSQVHGMVTQSGGHIRLASSVGNGTQVTLLLPRSLAPPAADAVQSDLQGAMNGVVLLVDDDDAVREVTAALLTANGYAVLPANDGPAALAILQEHGARVDLVIADYLMPGMTGRELLNELRQTWPAIPALLATGYAEFRTVTGDGLSADQIIRKPYRSIELLSRIRSLLERQSATAAAGG